ATLAARPQHSARRERARGQPARETDRRGADGSGLQLDHDDDARARPYLADAATNAVGAGVAELARDVQPVAGDSRAGVGFACGCGSRPDLTRALRGAQPHEARSVAHARPPRGGVARVRRVARLSKSRPDPRSFRAAALLNR